jgi:copper chaperone
MEKLKFKTNINCSGCVAKVTNQLNETVGEGNWSVDTDNPDKPLTVTNTDKTPDQVTAAIKKVGFKAEVVKD